MALPYNPVSPPPTAGPLPIIERANLNTPYSGGGGGGGPSTVVSTFNQLFTSSIGSAAPIANDFGIIGNGNNLVFDLSAPTLGQVQFQLSTSIGLGGDVPEISVQDTGGNGYTMSLKGAGSANVLVSVSSLVCSTINGVVPGGGSVPGNLAVSTLTLGIPGGITGVSTISGTNDVLRVTGLLSVSSITGVGAPLSLDGQGQVINIAATAVNIAAAPVNISSATISSINGAAPGALPNSLTLSTLAVSSLNGGVPAVFQFKPFTSYTEGANSCTLGTTYYNLVNGAGNLVMTFPETPGASWSGGGKYIKFGTNFTSGGMPSAWNIDNVSITCPDGTGAYTLNSWQSQVGGNQLTFNVSVGGSPSTFAVTAQVRLP